MRNTIWMVLSTLLALVAVGLSGYALYQGRQASTLTVRKLVLVDEHGTPRLIIAAGKESPGPIIRGRFYPPEMRSGFIDASPASIIFLNEEGTEQGAWSGSGRRLRRGTVKFGP